MFKPFTINTLAKVRLIKGLFLQYKLKRPYKSTNLGGENVNIVYVLPSSRQKTGGDKVIYKHSELINSLNLSGVLSEVHHPYNTSFKHAWFTHNVKMKEDFTFSQKSSFVVIPEIWAVPQAKMFRDINVKYAIFVQNGYSIAFPSYTCSNELLHEAYEHASVILSISDDATDCILLAFPNFAHKILRLYVSIDVELFNTSQVKENVITYMPRKLLKHSQLVLFFLKLHLPKHWRVQAIDNMSESEVVNQISKSKIFLSFSELEGFGLPPLEAALSGNYVIGYTGEGGNEYWEGPLFTRVSAGDIKGFVREVLNRVATLDRFDADKPNNSFKWLPVLADKYSIQNERVHLSEFVSRVKQLLLRH